MANYRVKWEIDIEADSPEEAAKEALKIQRDPDSVATIFDVIDDNGVTIQIDLNPEWAWQYNINNL